MLGLCTDRLQGSVLLKAKGILVSLNSITFLGTILTVQKLLVYPYPLCAHVYHY